MTRDREREKALRKNFDQLMKVLQTYEHIQSSFENQVRLTNHVSWEFSTFFYRLMYAHSRKEKPKISFVFSSSVAEGQEGEREKAHVGKRKD